MNPVSPLRDFLLCAWFALAAAAFWLPSLGFALPAGPLNALYAVFLLIFTAAFALRAVRQGGKDEDRTHRGR
ncbi:MAG: hypothetical protein H7Z41_08660 [Cytophagales bacterium]|nr:hypothetical protein [Armatimonadota bacterium]